MDLTQKQIVLSIERQLTLLENAAQNENWYKVKEANKKVQSLFDFAKTMPWFNSMHSQQKLSQQRYKKVIALIAEKQSAMKVKMQRHQSDKEGIEAYKILSEGIR